MYPVSEAFKVAVRYSHKVITKAEVLRFGEKIATIYPESGSVEIDQRRAIRRTASIALRSGGQILGTVDTYTTYATIGAQYATYTALGAGFIDYQAMQTVVSRELTVDDDGLVPSSGLDTLTPYGNELRLYRGIEYRQKGDYTYAALSGAYATYATLASSLPTYAVMGLIDGNLETIEELVPLGVFVITDVSINADDSGIAISLEGQDRALRISRARWTDPYQIASGTNVATALLALLQDRYPDIQTNFSDTTATVTAITLGLDTENDPWNDAVDIADAAGMALYFDADGICVLEPYPDYSVAATVETYKENEEAMLLTAQRTISSDGVYNAVVVTAEGTDMDTPFRSVALDDNPASPTYVYGPMGLVPMFASSPLINSQAAADNLATSKLNEIRGTNEGISWSQVVDPSLDASDIVAISNDKAKIARAIVLDRLTIPLRYDEAMSATGRTIVFAYGDTVVSSTGQVIITDSVGGGNTVTTDSSSEGGIVRSRAIR